MKEQLRVFFFGCIPTVILWVLIAQTIVHSFIWSMIWSGAEPHFEGYNRKAVSTVVFWLVSFCATMMFYSNRHYKNYYEKK